MIKTHEKKPGKSMQKNENAKNALEKQRNKHVKYQKKEKRMKKRRKNSCGISRISNPHEIQPEMFSYTAICYEVAFVKR